MLAADVDEFVASLDHWDSAPTVTRFHAQWMAIRGLAYNGHLEHAEQLLARFSPFVTDLDSRQASRLLADLHGTLASTRQDWRDAAHWYGKAVDATEGGLTTWFDLVAAWHLLATRCLCPESAAITAAELRDPWQCFQNERIDVLGAARRSVHGNCTTPNRSRRPRRPLRQLVRERLHRTAAGRGLRRSPRSRRTPNLHGRIWR